MPDSVRLNSWKNFLGTLRLIYLETWVMHSSANPGLSVFCDRLFLVFSGVSLETAANFLLFLKVPMILREKSVSCEDWIDFETCNKNVDLFYYEGKKVPTKANS